MQALGNRFLLSLKAAQPFTDTELTTPFLRGQGEFGTQGKPAQPKV